ncbi:hypothetical protein CMQ_2486 [Grosmannia clavigera kw1407]|uniref:Uncharacterized protein n=1 Tax=Grosmannia clavigera (strain kw1407 / UAMH 11150) TaxID=655863 RepID=F0XJG8_GROCL|nr:uncharacterized protein CMQ_2486 [Grosmannia clavigera kw1407]EFX02437.1 hypothetical protein CMQ_2486 [Grosmannia clavigera kw1407]
MTGGRPDQRESKNSLGSACHGDSTSILPFASKSCFSTELSLHGWADMQPISRSAYGHKRNAVSKQLVVETEGSQPFIKSAGLAPDRPRSRQRCLYVVHGPHSALPEPTNLLPPQLSSLTLYGVGQPC